MANKVEKLKTVLFNYNHEETNKNKGNIFEYSFNHNVKGLKEDFDLANHLSRDFVGNFFHGFASEEIFLIGIAVGRGLLTLEDKK